MPSPFSFSNQNADVLHSVSPFFGMLEGIILSNTEMLSVKWNSSSRPSISYTSFTLPFDMSFIEYFLAAQIYISEL